MKNRVFPSQQPKEETKVEKEDNNFYNVHSQRYGRVVKDEIVELDKGNEEYQHFQTTNEAENLESEGNQNFHHHIFFSSDPIFLEEEIGNAIGSSEEIRSLSDRASVSASVASEKVLSGDSPLASPGSKAFRTLQIALMMRKKTTSLMDKRQKVILEGKQAEDDSGNNVDSSFILNPQGKFYRIWGYTRSIGLLCYLFALPYWLLFNPFSSGILFYEGFLGFDVIIKILTRVRRGQKLYQIRMLKQILKFSLLCDFLSFVPWEHFFSQFSFLKFLAFFPFKRISILVKLIKQESFRLFAKSEWRLFVLLMIKLIRIFFMLAAIGHYLTCLTMLTKNQQEEVPDSMESSAYINYLSITITTITTVGMTNHVSKTVTEMLTACFVELIGILLFASVLRSIHTILKQRKTKNMTIASIDIEIEEWIYQQERKSNSLGLPSYLGEELKYVLLSYSKNDRNEILCCAEYFANLPHPIQRLVLKWYYEDFYRKFWTFFEDLSIPFCEGVTQLMKPELFPANWTVIGVGSAFKGIYFIVSGKVHIKNNLGSIFHTLKKGDYFGDTLMLDERSNISFEVSQFSSLLCIRMTAESFFSLYKRYSHDYRRIMKRSRFRREFIKGVRVSLSVLTRKKLTQIQIHHEESSMKKLDMQRQFVMNLKSKKRIMRSREEIPLPGSGGPSFRNHGKKDILSKEDYFSKIEFDERDVNFEETEKEQLDIMQHLDEKRKKYFEEIHLDDSLDVPVSTNPLWIHNFADLEQLTPMIEKVGAELQDKFEGISKRLENFLEEITELTPLQDLYPI